VNVLKRSPSGARYLITEIALNQGASTPYHIGAPNRINIHFIDSIVFLCNTVFEVEMLTTITIKSKFQWVIGIRIPYF